MIKEFKYLNLGRFSKIIDKDLLTLNEDGTFDYMGYLDFSKMELKSLKEIPIRFRNIYGSYVCTYNHLLSLEGGPEYVDGNFWCSVNGLISLYGAPEKVGGAFGCSINNLISLQYAPLIVDGGFYCSHNYLLSKVHLSKIKGGFDVDQNPCVLSPGASSSIEKMTYEQQMAELDFFLKYDDKNAYRKMLDVLNMLNVSGIEKRYDMINFYDDLDISHLA